MFPILSTYVQNFRFMCRKCLELCHRNDGWHFCKEDGKRGHLSRSDQANKKKKNKRFGVEEVKKAIKDYEDEGGESLKK